MDILSWFMGDGLAVFNIAFTGGLIALILLWKVYRWRSRSRCPACKTQGAYQPTGAVNAITRREEHRCEMCGYMDWVKPRHGGGDNGGDIGWGDGGD
ncbi:MAG: hypothetical protein L3K52_14280 [Candidatus Thiothrix sulfatifontis]|nr:MAG: hypothetical protein L3K52_14280 [Candidatus Thiothrix sulfatifontis]